MLNIRWRLLSCLLFMGIFAYAQSTDLLVEKLKQQVLTAYQQEGRDKALSLALLGNDYLAPNHPEMQRLLYESYYLSPGYDEYSEDYGYEEETGFQSADWSPDGSTLAVGASDGLVYFYTFKSRTPEKTSFRVVPGGAALDVAYSPDGTKIAVGGADGFTRIINVSTEQTTHSWSHGDYIRAVAWSPDGSLLAAGGDESTVYIYNHEANTIVEEFTGHTDWIRGLSWSKDGQYVAAASDDATATVWSIAAGDLFKTHRDHTDYCRDVVFSPAGDELLTVSDDLNGFIYNTGDASLPDETLSGHEGWIMSADWSANGQYIVTADNNSTVIIHNLRNDDQQYYNDPETEISWMDVDFASDNETIAVTTTDHITILKVGETRASYTLTLSGAEEVEEEGSLDEVLAEHLPGAIQVYPSSDGSKLGIIDSDYNVQVIDLEAGRLLYSVTDHTDWVRNIDWSSDGRLLATGGDDMMVGIWDASTGEMQQFLDGHTDWVRDVVFSADNKVLVSAGDDGVLRSWDTSTGDELSVTTKIESYLMTVDWSPNQQFLASQDSEGILHIWNARNNAKVFTSDQYTMAGTVKWTRDNSLTVIATEGGTLQWSAGNGLVESDASSSASSASSKGATATAKGSYIAISGGGTNTLLEGHRGSVTQMDWSNDGNYLVSQDDAGFMALWNVSKGQLVARMQFGDGSPKNLVWTPDGKSFYYPGGPDRLILDASDVRSRIEENYSAASISAEDVKYFELDKLIASNDKAKNALLANGDNNTLNAFADFYEMRADIQPNRTAADVDRSLANRFRTAAND